MHATVSSSGRVYPNQLLNMSTPSRTPLADVTSSRVNETPRLSLAAKRPVPSPFALQSSPTRNAYGRRRTNADTSHHTPHHKELAAREFLESAWNKAYRMPSPVELRDQKIRELEHALEIANLERSFL